MPTGGGTPPFPIPHVRHTVSEALYRELLSSTDLPASLQKFILATTTTKPGRRPSITAVDVYGPGSRGAFVRASSGARVLTSVGERKGFYLLVLHGHFVAASHPAGTKSPHGTIETEVWSARTGVTDSGIISHVPDAVSRLNNGTSISLIANVFAVKVP